MRRHLLAAFAVSAASLAGAPAFAQFYPGTPAYEATRPRFNPDLERRARPQGYSYEDRGGYERRRAFEEREERRERRARRRAYEDRGYGGGYGRSRGRVGGLCVTSRGNCGTRPRPFGAPCSCDLPGFGVKRGNVGR